MLVCARLNCGTRAQRSIRLHLLAVAVLAAGINLAWAVSETLLVPYLFRLGVHPSLAALVWAINPIVGVVAQGIVGAFADATGRRTPFIVVFTISACIGLILVAYVPTALDAMFNEDAPLSLVAACVFISFGIADLSHDLLLTPGRALMGDKTSQLSPLYVARGNAYWSAMNSFGRVIGLGISALPLANIPVIESFAPLRIQVVFIVTVICDLGTMCAGLISARQKWSPALIQAAQEEFEQSYAMSHIETSKTDETFIRSASETPSSVLLSDESDHTLSDGAAQGSRLSQLSAESTTLNDACQAHIDVVRAPEISNEMGSCRLEGEVSSASVYLPADGNETSNVHYTFSNGIQYEALPEEPEHSNTTVCSAHASQAAQTLTVSDSPSHSRHKVVNGIHYEALPSEPDIETSNATTYVAQGIQMQSNVVDETSVIGSSAHVTHAQNSSSYSDAVNAMIMQPDVTEVADDIPVITSGVVVPDDADIQLSPDIMEQLEQPLISSDDANPIIGHLQQPLPELTAESTNESYIMRLVPITTNDENLQQNSITSAIRSIDDTYTSADAANLSFQNHTEFQPAAGQPYIPPSWYASGDSGAVSISDEDSLPFQAATVDGRTTSLSNAKNTACETTTIQDYAALPSTENSNTAAHISYEYANVSQLPTDCAFVSSSSPSCSAVVCSPDQNANVEVCTPVRRQPSWTWEDVFQEYREMLRMPPELRRLFLIHAGGWFLINLECFYITSWVAVDVFDATACDPDESETNCDSDKFELGVQWGTICLICQACMGFFLSPFLPKANAKFGIGRMYMIAELTLSIAIASFALPFVQTKYGVLIVMLFIGTTGAVHTQNPFLLIEKLAQEDGKRASYVSVMNTAMVVSQLLLSAFSASVLGIYHAVQNHLHGHSNSPNGLGGTSSDATGLTIVFSLGGGLVLLLNLTLMRTFLRQAKETERAVFSIGKSSEDETDVGSVHNPYPGTAVAC